MKSKVGKKILYYGIIIALYIQANIIHWLDDILNDLDNWHSKLWKEISSER